MQSSLKRGECDKFAKWEKLEIRAVIKYFCKQEMPPWEIHEDFMENPGKESLSFSTVKKWAGEYRRGGEH